LALAWFWVIERPQAGRFPAPASIFNPQRFPLCSAFFAVLDNAQATA